MKVFSLTTGADTAGIGYGLSQAFRLSPDIELRSMVATQNYIGYPVDVPYDRERLVDMYDEADVILLHNTMHGHHFYDIQGKPTVLMHHGRTPLQPFLGQVAEARRIGALQVGSTLDLSVFAPEVEWSPPPVNIEAMRAWRQPSRTLTVGHGPTNRAIKGTEAFVAAMASLRLRHEVDVDLVEGMRWTECLARKSRCDIWFDQPTLGYGMNAVEAWAMGIPVLAGVANPRVRAAMVDRWGVLPFMETSEATLQRDLERLIVDPELRLEYSALGQNHVAVYHAESAVVERLSEVFRRAGRTHRGRGVKRRRRRHLDGVAASA